MRLVSLKFSWRRVTGARPAGGGTEGKTQSWREKQPITDGFGGWSGCREPGKPGRGVLALCGEPQREKTRMKACWRRVPRLLCRDWPAKWVRESPRNQLCSRHPQASEDLSKVLVKGNLKEILKETTEVFLNFYYERFQTYRNM